MGLFADSKLVVLCREPLQSAQTALKMTSEIAAEQVGLLSGMALMTFCAAVVRVVLEHHICGQLTVNTTAVISMY